MSSGESDAIRNVLVTETNSNSSYPPYTSSPTITWDKINTGGTTSNISYFTWPNYIYMYQIKCPVRTCKTMNWLQLDIITPCTKCKTKLKAVSQKADFEIEINS